MPRVMHAAAMVAGGALVAADARAAEPSDFDDPVARAAYCERISEAAGDHDGAADWFLARDMWAEARGASDGAAGRRAALPVAEEAIRLQHLACAVELDGLQDAIEAHFEATYGDDFGAPESDGIPPDAVFDQFGGAQAGNDAPFEPEDSPPPADLDDPGSE